MAKHLNENQKKAVFHEEGPMLVLAGPGSGKTTVLLCRIRRLLEEGLARPQELLVLTFSKAAAVEMEERAMRSHIPEGVLFGTFHSVCFRILRRNYNWKTDVVLGEDEGRNVLRLFLMRTRRESADLEETTAQFLTQYSRMRNELLDEREFEPEGLTKEEFHAMRRVYEEYKAENQKVDFDDMLTMCLSLLQEDREAREFWQRRFRFIMVDEFQDVNLAQYECLKLLAARHGNLFVVGDDDQSIYGFRGARPAFLLNFEKEFKGAERVTLNINYRSTERIIRLSEKVIGENKERFEKNMKGTGEEGERVRFFLSETAVKEAETIGGKIADLIEGGSPAREIAVIYRTNLQGGSFARELYRRGIPFQLRENIANIYEHWAAKDLLAYLLLAENEDSDSALRRILNKPKRYIGKELLAEAEQMPYTLLRAFFVCPSLKTWQAEPLETLKNDLEQIRRRKPYEALRYVRKVTGYDDYLEDYAAYRRTSGRMLLDIADEITELAKDCGDAAELRKKMEEMSLAVTEQGKKRKQKGVLLTTMHGAKGLEFQTVFLPTLVEDVVPHEKGLAADALEEERRLFYVGLTRAKERIWLSAVQKRYERDTKPSRFLAELGLDAEALFRKSREQ